MNSISKYFKSDFFLGAINKDEMINYKISKEEQIDWFIKLARAFSF